MDQKDQIDQRLLDKLRTSVNFLQQPTLVMQREPRKIVTANRLACALFGKELDEIENCRGGEAIDCIHAFTEAGCGKDINCETCKIKHAVIDTFTSSLAHGPIQTTLHIKRDEELTPHNVQVSTMKSGDYVLVIIEAFAHQP